MPNNGMCISWRASANMRVPGVLSVPGSARYTWLVLLGLQSWKNGKVVHISSVQDEVVI
jgi:protein involved in temperature-dependent protein secretion